MTKMFRAATLAAFCSVLSVVCFRNNARAQQGPAAGGPSISYAGQPVSSVELAGRPGLNLRTLQPLIAQKEGAPYSQQAIDETVAALKKTGQFEDVKPEVMPEANGLRVLFVLQPAYYFGIFQFPGAVKRMSYSRLLQAANYPRQEPYTTGRVEEAQSNLLDFFHQNGYFRATVEPKLDTDETHKIVNVSFLVKLGRHARYGQVLISGVPKAQTERLAHSLNSFRARIKGARLKTGKPYSLRRNQNAITFLQGQLGKQHYLAAGVRLLSAVYDPQTNRADVTFNIVQGPRIEIKVVGARVSGGTQRKLIPMYQENSVDADLVHEGQQNLISYFQAKGFFDVKVQSKFEHVPGGTDILYQVTKGARGKVGEIEFRGNHEFSDRELQSHVTVSEAKWYLPFFSHGKFSDALVRSSVKNLEGVYQNAGYREVKVTPSVKRDGSKLTVIFQLEEGTRDIVASLQLQGNKSIPQAELSPHELNLEPGKPFSTTLLNRDRDRIVATYLDKGFLTMVFRAQVTPLKDDPHRVEVVYNIQEGPQVFTSELAQLGAPTTRPEIVARNANIKVGKPLSETSLLQGESALYTLGVFDWASVDTRAPITDDSEAEVLIKLHEAKKNTLQYGFGFEVTKRGGSVPGGTVAVPGIPAVGLPENFRTSEETFWGPKGSFQYTRNNFRGRAETINVSIFAGRLDQRASAGWVNPNFWDSSWSSTLSASVERNSQNALYTGRTGNGTWQFQKFLDSKRTKTVFFRYNLSRTTLSNLLVPDLILPQDQNVRLSGPSASYSRDTRDNLLDAHKGIYQSFEVDLYPSALGSNTNFTRFLGQVAYYKPVFNKSTIWANSIRLGIEEAFSGAHIPLSESFFSGGGSTLRGFPLNGAGPQRPVTVCGIPTDPSTCAPISVPVGGPQLIILNSELRFPLALMKNLGGAAFYDGGNIFRSVGFSDFWQQYTNSVGGGIRYSTPIGPIRFDYGRLLNPVPGISPNQFFITLGQAF